MKADISIADALRWARARLDSIDAEALLCRVIGQPSAALIAGVERQLPARHFARFQNLVERRANGEPVAYLTGQREFWSLALAITPAVLIPRPETELLVEQVLGIASRRQLSTLLELGTGSGAIALALASELRRCKILATDISLAALEVARRNARALSLERVEFRAGDWFRAVAARRFDLIVANPPYVAADDAHLGQGDLRFEPKTALVSPRRGLADLDAIIAAAPLHLNDGGQLLLEHGYQQAEAVRGMLTRRGFIGIKTRRDLGGNERVTQGGRGSQGNG